MKHTILAAALVLGGAAIAGAQQTSADAAVRQPLELYLKGHATGNGDFWRQAFHPSARIEGMRDGKLVSRSLDEFVAVATGKPADDEAQRKRRIVSVDVTDDAASAKIELDYPKVRFTDYFTLLKVDGTWKIMSKVYKGEPKP